MEKPPEGAGISGNEEADSRIDGAEARLGPADYLWKWMKIFSRSKTPFNNISS
jgi:hypothetical protein